MKKVWYRKNVGKAMGVFLCLTLGVSAVSEVNTKAAGDSAIYVGDVDGDGSVTPKDVTKLRRYLAGGWDVTVDVADADVDGDGSVTPKDVTKLRRYLAGGWGVELPLKQAVAHQGTMRSDYGDVYYSINEYSTDGKLLKSRNYRLNEDSSATVYTYNTDGSSYGVTKGQYSKSKYDTNGRWRGSTRYFQDKILSGYEYKTEVNGHTTLETETEFLLDGTVNRIYVAEYDNSYKTKDDEYGREIKYTTKDKDGKILSYIEYIYDASGNMSKMVYYDSDGNITGSTEITYGDDGESEIGTEKDKNGKVTGYYIYEYYDYDNDGYKYTEKDASGNVEYSQEYEYYDNGSFKREISRDSDGKVTYYRENDEKGRQIKYISGTWANYEAVYNDAMGTVTVTSKGEKEDVTKTEYSFDEKTGIMSAKRMDEKGNILGYQKGEYDANANLIKLTNLDSVNEITDISEYTYDTVGLLVKRVYKDSTQVVTGSTEYKYNEYGKRVEQVGRDYNGVENSKTTTEYYANGRTKKEQTKYSSGYEYYYIYNENGYQLEYGNTDNGKISYTKYVRDDQGDIVKRIEYDDGVTTEITFENGKTISAIKTDADGNTISTTAYEYDENDNLIKELETDPQGTTVSSASYTYDDAGNETSYIKEYDDGTKDTRTAEYYDNGQTKKKISTYNDGESYTNEYYEDGKKKYNKTVYPDGYAYENWYYENGNRQRSYSKYSDGTSREDKYNEDGNQTLSVFYDAEGNETYRTEMEYEDGNQTLSVTYEDGVESYRTETEYHENGKKAKKTDTYASGSKEIRIYNKQGLEESYVYYDENNNITNSTTTTYDSNNKIAGKVEKRTWGITEYTYTDGMVSKRVEKTAEGKISSEYTDYTYDANGRATGYVYTSYNSSTGEVYSSTTYTKTYYDNGYTKSEKQEYSYGGSKVINYSEKSQERKISEYQYDEDGKVNSSYIYDYYDNGYVKTIDDTWKYGRTVTTYSETEWYRELEVVKYDSAGKFTSSVTYDYYDNGNKKAEISYDEDGNITSSKEYVYYESGRKQSEIETDSDGNYKVTTYPDSDNYNWRKTSETSYDKEDHVTLSIEYEYDKNGMPSSVKKTDDNGVTLTEYEYNAYGYETSVKTTYPDGTIDLEETEYDSDNNRISHKHMYPDGHGEEYYYTYKNGQRYDSKTINIIKRDDSSNYLVSLYYYNAGYGYYGEYFKASDVIETAGDFKYYKVINYFDDDGVFQKGLLYTVTEDKKETLNVTVSYTANENGRWTYCLWKFEDGKTHEWYYTGSNSYEEAYYELYKTADDTIIKEEGTNPNA